jgi:hypothetical protein
LTSGIKPRPTSVNSSERRDELTIADCRLPVLIAGCRLRVRIDVGDCRLPTALVDETDNPLSLSTIPNLNRQSTVSKPAIDSRQPAMFILDTMLIGGLRFVFDKIAAAVDTELNDDTALREQLLAAQMRVELGEMSQPEFDELEADILARLREIRDRRQGAGAATLSPDEYKITGIDARFEGDEH